MDWREAVEALRGDRDRRLWEELGDGRELHWSPFFEQVQEVYDRHPDVVRPDIVADVLGLEGD
jgi:hypothetical protein